MQAKLHHYSQHDDVFCSCFLKNILLVTDDKPVDHMVLKYFASKGCVTLFVIPRQCRFREGPYFFSSRGIFWAWRLFPDTQEAFVTSTIPSQHDSYMSVSILHGRYVGDLRLDMNHLTHRLSAPQLYV
jgi:hypothetical protein